MSNKPNDANAKALAEVQAAQAQLKKDQDDFRKEQEAAAENAKKLVDEQHQAIAAQLADEKKAIRAEADRLAKAKQQHKSPEQERQLALRRQEIIKSNLANVENVNKRMNETGWSKLCPAGRNGAHWTRQMMEDGPVDPITQRPKLVPILDEVGNSVYAYADVKGELIKGDAYADATTDPADGSKKADEAA